MSRNIGRTECYFCDSDVELLEPARPVTAQEVGAYADIYVNKLICANAWCPRCEAKYLAWVSFGNLGHLANAFNSSFVDLSFRSTFNDEPGIDDLPKYNVELVQTRTGPYDGHWLERLKR